MELPMDVVQIWCFSWIYSATFYTCYTGGQGSLVKHVNLHIHFSQDSGYAENEVLQAVSRDNDGVSISSSAMEVTEALQSS